VPLTVVGVAEDAKIETLGEEVRPVVYFHSAQWPTEHLHVMVRGTPSAPDMVGMLRRVIDETRPGLVVMEVKTMEDHLALRLFGPRAAGVLLGLFGIIALLLSSIGLYGVVSFSVSRRTREMGIRMSLGANRRTVVGMVIRQAMRMVLVGGLIGVVAGLVLGRVVEAFLLVISPSDPITMILVPIVLVGVALVAAAIPARRVTRVNPVEALRTD
jgi:ABC-type antimicrobial peptide transport system permease subunit